MGEAARKMASVVRRQWADYLQRFRPYENELMRQTTYENPAVLQQALDDAQSSTLQYFNNVMRERRTALQDFGVREGQDTRQVNERLTQLSKSAALVDAANNIRQRIMDRDREIAFGASGGDREMMRDLGFGGQ